MNNLNLPQTAELNILNKFLEISEKYGLKYYILGGTLLGAVRHKGFIPWDDDIDIGLPRPDYERFLQAAEAELEEPYDIYTGTNGKGPYSYYYARIVDTSIQLRRTLSETSVDIPLWIDIFPLDGVPEGQLAFSAWRLRCSYLYKLYLFSQFQYYFKADITIQGRFQKLKTVIKKLFYRCGFENLLNTGKIWTKLDHALKSVDYDDASRLINFCGHWGLKEMFPKSVYGEGALYPFEDLMIRGPLDYDYVLRQMYGDYMTPPADAEKNQHHIEIIESE